MDYWQQVRHWLVRHLPRSLAERIKPLPEQCQTGGQRARGDQGEALAAAYLHSRGLRILARNYQCRAGELDLIAQDGTVTVFVEVRLRQNGRHGGAAASITPTKQRRIVQAARHWLTGKPARSCRFDAVLLDSLDASAVTWIRGAFDET